MINVDNYTTTENGVLLALTGDARVEITFVAQIYYETDWSMMLSESCNLEKDKWTRFEFPVSSLEAFPGSIQIGLTVSGHLWLDDVELVRRSEAEDIAGIRMWDTLTPLPRSIDQVQGRSEWKILPTGTSCAT